MVRGSSGGTSVKDDPDRAPRIARLAVLAEEDAQRLRRGPPPESRPRRLPSPNSVRPVAGRTRPASQPREGIAYLWTPVLGSRPQNVYWAAAQGQAAAAEWQRLLATC